MKQIHYNKILYLTIIPLFLSLFGMRTSYYEFIIPFIMLITYVLLFKVLNSDDFNENEIGNLFYFFVFFTFFLVIHIYVARVNTVLNEGYLVIATYNGKTHTTDKRSCRFVYDYKDINGEMQRAFIDVTNEKYDRNKYPTRDSSGIIKSILYVTEKDCHLYKDDYVSTKDIEKFKYPVTVINRDIELGNDSYEYAKYERDIAYKYYGLNIVQIATSYDNNTIVFTKLNGEKDFISKKNNPTDTFLVYSNINPDFYDGWHIHSHSTKNIAKVKESGYGYLFRGKIYSAAETEKYWNIIEQYKLRN